MIADEKCSTLTWKKNAVNFKRQDRLRGEDHADSRHI